jgi:hypothetical protein
MRQTALICPRTFSPIYRSLPIAYRLALSFLNVFIVFFFLQISHGLSKGLAFQRVSDRAAQYPRVLVLVFKEDLRGRERIIKGMNDGMTGRQARQDGRRQGPGLELHLVLGKKMAETAMPSQCFRLLCRVSPRLPFWHTMRVWRFKGMFKPGRLDVIEQLTLPWLFLAAVGMA